MDSTILGSFIFVTKQSRALLDILTARLIFRNVDNYLTVDTA